MSNRDDVRLYVFHPSTNKLVISFQRFMALNCLLVIKLVCNTKYDTKSHPLTGGTTSDFSPTKSDENGSNPPMLSILSIHRVFASGGKLSAYKDSFDMLYV